MYDTSFPAAWSPHEIRLEPPSVNGPRSRVTTLGDWRRTVAARGGRRAGALDRTRALLHAQHARELRQERRVVGMRRAWRVQLLLPGIGHVHVSPRSVAQVGWREIQRCDPSLGRGTVKAGSSRRNAGCGNETKSISMQSANGGAAGRFCQEILTAETTDSYGNFPPALIGGARLPK